MSSTPPVGDRVPSLDGLRAVSIACVLVAHSFFAAGREHPESVPIALLENLGPLGVTLFFGISGFIITTLLAREQARRGRISLGEFYLRRAFRILPPLWVYVAAVALLAPPPPEGAFRHTLLFLTDYLRAGWWLGHTWSLSVEEQFYLLWPATLAVAGRRGVRVALLVLLASPVIRSVHHLLSPWESLSFMFHARMDALAVGCLVALERGRLLGPAPSRALATAASGPAALLSAAFLAVASPLLVLRFHGWYEYPVRYTLEALAVASILVWALRNPASAVGRLLNLPAVAHVGVLSYSLYLWQQPFFSGEARNLALGRFPLNVLAALAVAELSYRLVERPALGLRDRVLGWRRARRAAALAPAEGRS
ncbi:MAG: acyltransferase [Anaeromyxobacteraceae bacterium]